ncbi:MAG: response regulator [Candidatus Omnitrophica bacterium]|nr:response regulator [Candidatus Omnitrophota bacterium]
MKNKILVVDDELDLRKLVAARLSKAGYDVIEASNGQEGLDLMKKENPDMVLLDLLMPVMDGYAVCRTAKKDETIKNIPIILFAAKLASKTIDKEVKELGAIDFIGKPFEAKELLEKIEKVLSAR